MTYALRTTVERPHATVLADTRRALADQGFGVLTEIDLQATLKAKLDAEIAPQVILGACRPPLAHAAIEAEPSIGLLLPCNVVVRASSDTTTVVEAVDPQMMLAVTGNPTLQAVSDEAAGRLRTALDALGGTRVEQA
ncbi:uncharacterized protein (DUF302 family) [Friedmanniella endophytica]|uniref:Uncharacterized protein (DUF302 family) n=1 Tax=Microlunatus kandeliicorticis TaxID=1759536 RepID=A0A7W3IVP3_9ACTN|nr:DUF302 domain-containing protein [Microlunatus kandeliicorticis]MBA8796128.1 uncharacterized protein (DUF302 family) [Microlunatus kandeliicorticis]